MDARIKAEVVAALEALRQHTEEVLAQVQRSLLSAPSNGDTPEEIQDRSRKTRRLISHLITVQGECESLQDDWRD